MTSSLRETSDMNAIVEYHAAIERGEILACKKLKKLLNRLVVEVRDGCGRWHYDQRKADQVIYFVTHFCRHSHGTLAGQRVDLMLWQRAFLSALFGFVDDTGERRFKECLLWVARKNSKSFLASSIALFLLIGDSDNVPGGADVVCAATKSQQAKIVFDECVYMMEQDKTLRKHTKKRQYDLFVPKTRSKLEYVGKNSETLDGKNLHGVIIDELHSIRDRNMYEVLKQSQSAKGNRSPLLLMISTAGTTRGSVGDDIYDYAASVVNGTFEDERFLAWIYELDEREEYLDPEKFVLANPGIDVIKDRDELFERVQRSANKSTDVPGLLTKDFNWRTSIGTESWLQFDEYHCEKTYDLKGYRNSWTLGGCDLSKCGDLTSAAVIIYDRGEFIVKHMSWIPESAFEQHVREDKVPYDVWRDRGLVRVCPGSVIDTTMVTAWFNELIDDYGLNVHSVWYDAWSATTWVSEMQGWGYDMHPVRQGVRTLSLPMEHLGALFKDGKVNYGRDSLFEWAVSNVTVFTDSNGMIKPNKQTNKGTGRKRRIDPLAAVLNAFVGFYDESVHDEYLGLQEQP